MPEDSNAPKDTFWWRLVNLNPAILRGLIVAVVAILGSVGILVSDSLADQLVGVWVGVMALVQALWTRSGVTPNAKVLAAVKDPSRSDTWIVPGEATTSASDGTILRAVSVTPRA